MFFSLLKLQQVVYVEKKLDWSAVYITVTRGQCWFIYHVISLRH